MRQTTASPNVAPVTKVTIDAIAKAAGVSPATVSKVLNSREDVSAATRHLVNELLAHYGYTPRKRLAKQVPIIDLVFEDLDSPWAIEIIRGAVAAAEAKGYDVVLGSLNEGGRRRTWLDQIVSRGSQGVILLLHDFSKRQVTMLRSRRLPFVVVDPRGDPGPEVPAIGATNWAGGLSATRHLIELGHKRIAVISGPTDLLSSRARVDGFQTAMAEAALQADPRLVRWGNFLAEGGFEHATSLFSLHEPPTAVFAGSDLQAIGVVEAAREYGLRVPEDLSVVGFDDLPLSKWLSPPLTTVRQPLREMAAMAVQLVLALGSEAPVPSGRIEVATSLVLRESTAPPRRTTRQGAASGVRRATK